MTISTLPFDEALTGVSRGRPSLSLRVLRVAQRKPLGTIAAVLLVVVTALAVMAPRVTPSRYDHQDFGASLESPNRTHVMGTDELGRDTFSRIIYGARVSLGVGVSAVALGLVLGITTGLLCGYAGGLIDLTLQRIMDAMLSMPLLLTAMVVVTVLGASVRSVIFALGITVIPTVNRVVRGSVLSVKASLYVDAARALGCPSLRIVVRHILPNILAPVIVAASVTMGFAIITEASLSFLGMGVPPPFPTWGGMLSGSGVSKFEQQPWLAIFPGLAISLVVLAFNLLGDTLRDILDPRLRSE
jgi:peptide/nickel transport system permease protein